MRAGRSSGAGRRQWSGSGSGDWKTLGVLYTKDGTVYRFFHDCGYVADKRLASIGKNDCMHAITVSWEWSWEILMETDKAQS